MLLGATVAVSVTGYFYLKRNEHEKFETSYFDQATRVIDAVQIQSNRRVGTIQAFAESITSHALHYNMAWPNVTLPDFERQATATSRIAGVMSLFLVPLVQDWQREQWEEYSVANQAWLEEGLEVQKEEDRRRRAQNSIVLGWEEDNDLSIPEKIYRVEGLAPAPENGPGPYLPQWQVSPALEDVPELVNFNLLSHPGYKDSLNAMLSIEAPVVGRSFDFTDTNDFETAGRRDVFELFLQKWTEDNDYGEDPVADLHWPIFDSFDENNRTLVGLLTSVIYWRTYFEDILADNSVLDVVLSNTCNQTYTYQINGTKVNYLGPGDRHDPTYDLYKVATNQGAYLQGDTEIRSTQGSCLYSMSIYPTQEYESHYLTSQPAIYTSMLVVVFFFIYAVFQLYDCLVERRQKVMMNTARASSAIVASLFPKSVRDRLYGKEPKEDEPVRKSGSEENKSERGFGTPALSDEDDDYDRQTSDRQTSLEEAETASVAVSTAVIASRPIADLFPACTVMFADIPGFASWSSAREPTDVFFLLETIYGAFDKIARKRHVFKVETIGDCYMAGKTPG